MLQVAGGAGSPAPGRRGATPGLAQISPLYGLIQRTFRTPDRCTSLERTYFELTALVNTRLNELWDGRSRLSATVQAVAAEAPYLAEGAGMSAGPPAGRGARRVPPPGGRPAGGRCPAGAGRRLNVVVIMTDTLRPDHTAAAGNTADSPAEWAARRDGRGRRAQRRTSSPGGSAAQAPDWIDTREMDRFAAGATVFTRAYAGSFPTVPCRHGLLHRAHRLPRARAGRPCPSTGRVSPPPCCARATAPS